MNTKKVKRLLAMFFLTDLLLLGVYGYLFFMTNAKTEKTTALYLASRQAASDKEKIHALERMLKETEKERARLSEYFVTKTNAVTFIEQIEKIGKNADVDLTVNSVSGETKDSGAIALNFSATGSFSALYRLIALVESMPYKATLKKTDMQRSDQKEKAAWKGNFTVMLESFAAGDATTTPAETKK
jgi:hypothetical protein